MTRKRKKGKTTYDFYLFTRRYHRSLKNGVRISLLALGGHGLF
jgi:hypothetical protein